MQQKEERLECNEVMVVEEAKRQKEHVRRREEAELCRLPAVGDKDDPESRASYPESAGGKKKTLYNNWVGEKKTESDPVKENIGTNSSTYLLFAAKVHTSEGLYPIHYIRLILFLNVIKLLSSSVLRKNPNNQTQHGAADAGQTENQTLV